MTTSRRGEVVLADFPFSDQARTKLRPGLVVSSDRFNSSCADLVIAQITSRLGGHRMVGDYPIKKWRAAGLERPSQVRARMMTVSARMVRRTLGAMPADEMAEIDKRLRAALGL